MPAFEDGVGREGAQVVDAHGFVGGGCCEEGEAGVRRGVPGAGDGGRTER
jgi:hypothetical protein